MTSSRNGSCPFSAALQQAIGNVVRSVAVPQSFRGKVIVHHYTDTREYLQTEVELRHTDGTIEFKLYVLDAEKIKHATSPTQTA